MTTKVSDSPPIHHNLPKGQRRCTRCRQHFVVGTSPVTRYCLSCYETPKRAKNGQTHCTVCGVLFSSTKTTVRSHFCSTVCANQHQRSQRDSLRGRLNLCLQKARKRRDCTLTIEWLLHQWDQQDGRCYYTGWQLELLGAPELRPTIERLASSVGYVPENVVICCKQANWAKNSYTLAQFLKMCLAVATKHAETT